MREGAAFLFLLTIVTGGVTYNKGREKKAILLHLAAPQRTVCCPLSHLSRKYVLGENILTKLEGKVAVITGASTGIGLATAQRFVAEGAYVYITGRRQDELDAAIRQIGKNVTGVLSDASNLADLDRLYTLVKQQHGNIDVLFANAGGGEFAPLGAISEEHFDKTFSTNVKGLLFTVQKALPLLQDGSSIILNASTTSIKGGPAFSVYSANKAAVRSFARTWTVDLQARHIRVNAISPGSVNTPGLRGLAQDEEQAEQMRTFLAGTIPMGRLGDPDEIAKVVVFLASDDSSFVTGIELFADGGQAQI
jgi:NAD(P)-dependent dehydrogenase (short-subunit alcohol dehydrogenase family)